MAHKMSADGVAALRAAAKRDGPLSIGDDLAEVLLPPHLQLVMRHTPLRWVVVGLFDWYIQGILGTHVARTRWFDARVHEACGRGARQIVILGAGLDTRAWRIGPKYGCRVFELDLPENQAEKRRRATRGGLPPAATYVEADLSREWAEMLVHSGFSTAEPTVWLLEGVSMYLEADALDALVGTVARLSAAGSEFLFDFFLEAVFRRPEDYRSARRHFRYMASRGEVYRAGLDPDAIPALLAKHDLTAAEILTPESVDALWLTDERGRFAHRSLGFLGLCHARFEPGAMRPVGG